MTIPLVLIKINPNALFDTMSEDIQRKIILEHLKKYGSITSWQDAICKYRITRLSKYINDFRNEGMIIPDKWEYGDGKHWKRYFLGEEVRQEYKVEKSGQLSLTVVPGAVAFKFYSTHNKD